VKCTDKGMLCIAVKISRYAINAGQGACSLNDSSSDKCNLRYYCEWHTVELDEANYIPGLYRSDILGLLQGL